MIIEMAYSLWNVNKFMSLFLLRCEWPINNSMVNTVMHINSPIPRR